MTLFDCFNQGQLPASPFNSMRLSVRAFAIVVLLSGSEADWPNLHSLLTFLSEEWKSTLNFSKVCETTKISESNECIVLAKDKPAKTMRPAYTGGCH